MADIHIHLPLSAGTSPNQDAPPARSGVRRAAIQRVFSAEPSDGEKQSNLPGDKPRENVVTANPPAAKSNVKGNRKPLERVPPFAKEPIERANEQARALHRKGR